MGWTGMPTDEEMRDLRDRGLLVCRCARPDPRTVPIFGGQQCARCLRLVNPKGQEQ